MRPSHHETSPYNDTSKPISLSDHIKIVSDHFKIISDNFKTIKSHHFKNKCKLGQPN